MKQTFEYSTVEVFPLESEGFNIKAPTFEATTEASLDEVLKAVPNLMQEREKGEWETYSTIFIGSTIVFFIRRQVNQVLIPNGIFK